MLIALSLAAGIRRRSPRRPSRDRAASADKLLALTPTDRVLGQADAPITIIEYASLTCPHCAHFASEVLPKLKEKWIDTGKAKLILRDFPLDEPALRAAMVARCAPPDRFYPLVEMFFETQEQVGACKGLPAPRWSGSRCSAGSSKKEFDSCLDDKALEDQVLAKPAHGVTQQLGVNSTPTFFINGKKFDGEPTVEAFDADAVGIGRKIVMACRMQVERLRLAGFKSFVDPTELAIEPGLTGIVGPNGCGKSNLVEALRWVMGEASARRLRGGEMDDVIFAGSGSRPARNLAEVALTLDNARARCALRLQRPRRRSRSCAASSAARGSAYRINGREVRARDVQLLFADAATGPHSGALVSQGRIGALIAAKPTERRLLLDEAAGTAGLHAAPPRGRAEAARPPRTICCALDDVIADPGGAARRAQETGAPGAALSPAGGADPPHRGAAAATPAGALPRRDAERIAGELRAGRARGRRARPSSRPGAGARRAPRPKTALPPLRLARGRGVGRAAAPRPCARGARTGAGRIVAARAESRAAPRADRRPTSTREDEHLADADAGARPPRRRAARAGAQPTPRPKLPAPRRPLPRSSAPPPSLPPPRPACSR